MGNRIKDLRLEKGLSQRKLSDETGVSQQALSLYEKGERNPKIETWQKLANYFDVSVSYLQGVSDIKNLNKILSNPDVTFRDWLNAATPDKTLDDDHKLRAISNNEFKAFSSERNIIEFDMIFKALINKFDSEVEQKKYTDYKDKIDSTGDRSNISELVKSVFKIALEAKIGDKDAEKSYEKIRDEVSKYFKYDELPF